MKKPNFEGLKDEKVFLAKANINQKIKSQGTRKIPLQDVLMRFTDAIFDFR